MRNIFHIFLLMLVATSLSACGVKGNLKTPDQIEALAAKKAKQEEEKKAKEETSAQESKESVEQK